MRAPTEALVSAATSTFESLAFIVADETPGEDPAGLETPVEAWVAFRGPVAGILAVSVPSHVLARLTANMLGEEAAPAEPLQRDALGEIANVICGTLLPELGGCDAIFVLDPPVVEWPSCRCARDSAEPAATVNLVLDEGWASMELYLDAAPVEACA